MTFQIVPVDLRQKKQTRAFLELPFRIYQDIPQWVPPPRLEAKAALDPRRNPFYAHSEAAFFLAYEALHEPPIGRLSILDNHNYNAFNQEHTAFFYLFECENNPEAAQALFAAGFAWARQRGLNKVTGPKGFTALDGMGLLVKGFEHRPAFGLPYNPPYYPALIEAAGFILQGETVSGYLNARAPFPEKIHQLSALIQKRRGLRVSNFQKRRDLRRFVPRLRDLYNHSLTGTQGNVPLTENETATLANQLLWFADPRLIKIIFKGEEPVGYLFAYPDVSAALQRTQGRLFPFGWLDLLLEMRRTRWVNVNGAGIVEEYRGLGGTAILFSEMQKSILAGGFEHADLVQIGVENDRMQRELRDLGIDFYKTHRVYQIDL